MNMNPVNTLAIVIPFLAKDVAKNWKQSVYILQNTINSIINTERSDLKIFIICHQIPPLTSHKCIEYHPIKTPVPNNTFEDKVHDKGIKVMTGVQIAYKKQFEWVMFMDADDLLSSTFKDIKLDKIYDAYVFSKGYTWSVGSKYLYSKNRFHKICGTSYIMKLNKMLFPNWLDNKAMRICDQSHSDRENALKQAKHSISYIIKPMVIYLRDHGDNHSQSVQKSVGTKLKYTIKRIILFFQRKKLTHKLRQEFNIYETYPPST